MDMEDNSKESGSEKIKNLARACLDSAYQFTIKGQIQDAIQQYQKSIQLFPTAEAYTFLGWAYSFQGRYSEAISECRKAIQLDPEFGNPYNDIGAYLIEKGALDEAILWLRKALAAKRYDSFFYPHFNLGRIYELKGNWLEAFASYERALKLNPGYDLARKSINRLKALFN